MAFNFTVLQNRKIKMHKLYGNLLYITMTLRAKLGFCKLKSCQLFIQMIKRQTVKFYYCKAIVPHGK